MTLKKRILKGVKSREIKYEKNRKKSRHDSINAWLMSLATFGLLLVAAAQLYLAREQTAAAAGVAKLQLAQAKPRLNIIPSDEIVRYGGREPGSFVELPEFFSVKLISGIDTIVSIEAPITLEVSDDDGATSCYLEVRGLYVEDEQKAKLELFAPPRDDFGDLIFALREQGIEFNYPQWDFVVRYFDLFDEFRIDFLGLKLNTTPPRKNSLTLYNGIWSDGAGFYYDDAPEKWCPSIAAKIESVVDNLKGAPGNFGDALTQQE